MNDTATKSDRNKGRNGDVAGIGLSLCLNSAEQLARLAIAGDDTLLTILEVAAIVGISPRGIYRMIHRGNFPGPRKLGALSRWRLGRLKQWLHADELRRC